MNERSIFLEALDKADAVKQSAYLDTACGGDAALRQRLGTLLRSHATVDSFLGKLAPERLAQELAGAQTAASAETPPGVGAGPALDFLAASEKPGSLGRLGHYEILESIGRGGMGVVLKAFDEQLHRNVAIKVMAPQLATNAMARMRFVREARAAAAVRNEHVIDIHAVEEANDLPYLAMEYVAGVSLQERLDKSGPLQLAEILRIGMQAAAGLAAAHAQGLIHRDIKPSNILLENGVERVKITDFGLARAVDDVSLTQSGVIAGTPQFMSPEQARGETVDHRTDLFSLGSVMYAMCTGRAPFRATGTMAVLKRVCEDTPRAIREVNPETPDWLSAIIAKLQAKNPADRFQSAAEVADLLSRHLAHVQQPSVVGQVSNLPVDPKAGWKPAPHRRRLALAAAVLLCLVAVLAVTEATSISNLRDTVIRIFTPDGTPVVEVAGMPLSQEQKLEQARQQLDEAGRLYKLGEPLRGTDPWQAELHFRKAMAIYEKLGQDFPEISASKQKLEPCRWSLGSALHMQANQIVFKSPAATPVEVQRAVALGKESVVLGPTDKGFWITLGVAQGRAGDWKAACESLEKAEQLPIRSASVYHEIKTKFPLATAYWQLGDKAKARERYEQASELMEKHKRTDVLLRGLQAEAGKLLGIEIPKNPGAADAKPSSDIAPVDAKLLAELAGYDATLKEDPKDLATLNKRGAVLRRLQRFDAAVADYSKILEAVPDRPEWATAYIARAELRQMRDDWQGAIADYQAWVRVRPKEGLGAGRLAALHLFAPAPYRDADKARLLLEGILKVVQTDHGYTTSLGIAYLRLDRLEEAVAMLEKATTLRHGPDSYDQFALAMAYQRRGQKEKAQACFQKGMQTWSATTQAAVGHTFALPILRAEAEELLDVRRTEK